VAGPATWNILPLDICTASDVSALKTGLLYIINSFQAVVLCGAIAIIVTLTCYSTL